MTGQSRRHSKTLPTHPLQCYSGATARFTPAALPSLSNMCITKLSRHPGCGHWSCEIIEPCKEGRDFSNCPSFTTGKARNPAKYPQESAKEKTCPKCDKKDDYDGKKIRMVKGTAQATKFGLGPSVSHLLQDHFQVFPPVCTAFGVASLVSTLANCSAAQIWILKETC